MASAVSTDRLRFVLNRIRQRLWVRPLAMAVLSIAAVLLAGLAEGTGLDDTLPSMPADTVESILSIMAASMLVIATFAVASMVSALASASASATPRSFTLIVSDDLSQNALSTFIGAFIFSIVALIAMKNDYYAASGRFIIFVLGLLVLAIVIFTFVRWVDRIARLGRLGTTIDKVEQATAEALMRRRDQPHLRGVPVTTSVAGRAVYSDEVGYVQHINVSALQDWAEKSQRRVVVAALPGTFATPDRALAEVISDAGEDLGSIDCAPVVKAFEIGDDRKFDDDPRFGLVVLSEIASRALSPGINDPGTAIDVIGTLVRLFDKWRGPRPEQQSHKLHDRVEVPEISVKDMFDDAFTGIARDGAGTVEVAVRMQKALLSLASLGDAQMREAAVRHSRMALTRCERAMESQEDLSVVRRAARAGPPRGPAKTGVPKRAAQLG